MVFVVPPFLPFTWWRLISGWKWMSADLQLTTPLLLPMYESIILYYRSLAMCVSKTSTSVCVCLYLASLLYHITGRFPLAFPKHIRVWPPLMFSRSLGLLLTDTSSVTGLAEKTAMSAIYWVPMSHFGLANEENIPAWSFKEGHRHAMEASVLPKSPKTFL